jgi:KUP system potassium uptake protein
MPKELEDWLEPGGGAQPPAAGRQLAALSLVALGVVYGDIGTSPLYALRECFHGPHAVEPRVENVLGVLSLVLWSLMLVISLKYLVYILRADNRGEGGILALMALVHPDEDEDGTPARRPRRLRSLLVFIGLFGATLLYADGTLTPAISVLSAVEGLEVATPVFTPFVLPITIGILLGLFLIQRRGTAGVGRIFGPVMALWFATLAVLGVAGLLHHPAVLGAVDPIHAVRFFAAERGRAYVVLGSVFLVVTGGEALYADIGHFGRRPIRLAWFALVLPALVLNYFGQGALLLAHPESAVNPFYRLAPGWALYPLVALATLATVIASQAVISGSFSLTRQAIQLRYCPRLTIRHTSAEHLGQVYLPGVNGALMLTTIGLVLAFRRSTNLAGAYGVAVSTTMVITTLLAGWVAVERWGWSRAAAAAVSVGFLLLDLSFFGANLTKLPAGGWFPILLAALLFLLMATWKRGMDQIARYFRESRISLDEYLEGLAKDPPLRVPGIAVFLSASPGRTPTALLHQIDYNHILHEHSLVLTVVATSLPYVPARDRLDVQELPLGVVRVVARYGFMQTPRVPALLKLLEKYGLDVDPDQASYFLSREVAIPTEKIGMPRWRAWIFALLSRNAQRASDFFHLPHDRVIELGVEVEL